MDSIHVIILVYLICLHIWIGYVLTLALHSLDEGLHNGEAETLGKEWGATLLEQNN